MSAFDLTFSPDEWHGRFVVVDHEGFDSLSQFPGTVEAGPAQALAREDAEPDFDLIEPAGRGGREVETNIGMQGRQSSFFLCVA